MIQMDTELIKETIAFLHHAKRTHDYCDDGWYTCPKHEEGCLDPEAGTECNCGADAFNKEVDDMLLKLEKVIK